MAYNTTTWHSIEERGRERVVTGISEDKKNWRPWITNSGTGGLMALGGSATSTAVPLLLSIWPFSKSFSFSSILEETRGPSLDPLTCTLYTKAEILSPSHAAWSSALSTRDFPQKVLWNQYCESQSFFVALKHILAQNRNLDCMIKTHETS